MILGRLRPLMMLRDESEPRREKPRGDEEMQWNGHSEERKKEGKVKSRMECVSVS